MSQCHCEERSDEAISSVMYLSKIATPRPKVGARNDKPGSGIATPSPKTWACNDPDLVSGRALSMNNVV